MTLIFKVILIIVILLFLRFVICLDKLIRIRRYFKDYLKYVENPKFKFNEKKPQIIKLFKDAGIGNFVIPRLKPAGYGHISKVQIYGFENITLLDSEVITLIEGKFHEAIGVFRQRLLQTVNPIFWIEFVFTLPKFLFDYFGMKSDNFAVKTIQIIYWLIGILIGLEKLNILDLFEKI